MTDDTRPEFERRFLINPATALPELLPYSKLLEDRYLSGTRLRLRRQTDSDTGRVIYKLTKKFESASLHIHPIVSIALSPIEFQVFEKLPGQTLRKRRKYWQDGPRKFALDFFEGALAGLILCEIEAPSAEALSQIPVPPFVAKEVTLEPFFTGGHLCALNADELQRRFKDN